MKRMLLLLVGLALVMGALTPLRGQAATFPINYPDPASDVVELNSTTNLCVVDTGGACVMSPDPADVNILQLQGRESIAAYNLTIQVKGRIRDYANTSYIVDLYGDPTNRTHWLVNYTNTVLLLYSNGTGAARTDISGNATIWGPNPVNRNAVSMTVAKSLLPGPGNFTASVDIDATAIMRGDPGLGQRYSYQDFGWQVPGHPASTPTLLRGHVYERGTTTGIAGATVRLSSTLSVLTDATGYYQVSVAPGTYNVTVSASGYASQTFTVTLALGATVTKDVELDRAAGAGPGGDYLVPAVLIVALLALLLVIVLVARRRRKKGVLVPGP